MAKSRMSQARNAVSASSPLAAIRARNGQKHVSERVSKSQFKPRALEYFRQVEATGRELVITDHGRPVVKIVPYVEEPDAALAALRGSVLRYERPTEPVAEGDWKALE